MVDKTVQAQKVLRSWLRACDIDFGEHPRGLRVGDLDVFMAHDQDELEEGLNVNAVALASPDPATALEVFQAVTEAAGQGMPTPVDRGQAPTVKEMYSSQDLFLVAGRHREFRHSPDLPRSKVLEYEPVVHRACRSFLARNRRLCGAHGYEFQDLTTFAWVWTHIFAHKGELPGCEHVEDNRKLLSAYLRQRFAKLFGDLWRRAGATFPDRDTAQYAITGEVFEAHLEETGESDEDDEEDPVARRQRAVETLKNRLSALPHDQLVQKLEHEATSQQRDHATRMVALKHLRAHAKDCVTCAGRRFSLSAAEASQGI